jgi:glycosyltransferase involved in cell wall biosynthesis/SAM-dependent methyltransferase
MKIAVTCAFGWPYVRRGNRVAYELASYLAVQGHEVHFITTKPGAVWREKARGNLLIKYYPVIDNPILTHFKIEYWQTFALSCLWALLKEDYDIVHTSLTMDVVAASLNRSLKGTPFIPVLINGDPLYRDALWAKRLFHRAVKKASRLVTISKFVNEILKRDYSVEGVMIPCPVDTSKFYYAKKGKSDVPKILCTATLIMERKRIPLLLKAFEMLIEHVPGAILQLAGETTPGVTRKLLMSVNEKTRTSIEIVDITSDEVLVSFYRNATITVLPSLKEPFGMVTTESLASGTPVVGTRSGGTAEILRDPRIGVMFEPTDGPEELCRALIKCIELARDPETPKRCSEYARQYSWTTLGPKYEELYMEVINKTGRRSSQRRRTADQRRTPSFTSAGPVRFNGNAGSGALRGLFLDVLDELEVTMQTYYKIESCMPRSIYILKWMFAQKVQAGNVLLLSSYPHFLALLFNKLGFRVRHIVINGRVDSGQEHIDFELTQSPHALTGLQESFDVIVCDDVIHHLAEPDEMFRLLKRHVAREGVLILTSPNTNQSGNRPNLLTDPDLTSGILSGAPLGGADKPDTQQRRCRGYSLRELEKAGVNAGFTLLKKAHITGEKHIDKTNTFAHVPLRKYFTQKLHRLFQFVAVSSRSHLFVAMKGDEDI